MSNMKPSTVPAKSVWAGYNFSPISVLVISTCEGGSEFTFAHVTHLRAPRSRSWSKPGYQSKVLAIAFNPDVPR